MRVPSSVYSVLQHLRRAGLRPTVARIAILQVVQAAPAPGIGADVAYLRLLARGTRASLSTVHRAFAQLEAAGLLYAVQTAPPHGLQPSGRWRALYRSTEMYAANPGSIGRRTERPPHV